MYISVKFFKSTGKYSHEETIYPADPQPSVWDTQKISEIIEKNFNNNLDYMFEAIDNRNNFYNCYLVKRIKELV